MFHKKFLKLAGYGLSMLLLTAVVAGATTLKSNKYLSNESALALKDLNQEYDMVITEDLLHDDGSSSLMASLLQADVLQQIPGEEDPENQGLIVSFKSNDNGLLLIQPTKELSEEELQSAAKKYESVIPEANFELDQNIINSEIQKSVQMKVSIIDGPETYEEKEEILEKTSVEVAVIDTGIQANHPQFHDVYVSANEEANLIKGGNDVSDDIGHGTHVAGIIAENAPHVVIKPYKIVDQNGGRLSYVIKAIDLAIEDEVEVINMSFGVMESSYALEKIIEKAHDNGVVVVAAAGNFGSDDGFYPAFYDDSIAVGGVYESGQKMRTSNYGDWVDVAALGYRINSSVPSDSYAYKDGTSQSTAFVSAEVAKLLMENPKLDPDEVVELLKGSKTVRGSELSGVPIVEGQIPSK